MLRRISENFAGRMLMMTAGLMLATAGLAALPASSASASTPVVVSWWGTSASHYEENDPTSQCGTTWQTSQGDHPVLEVYNPCNSRVWVHYVEMSTGQEQEYCINPGGGLAYDIPMQWTGSNKDISNIQLTNNTSQCDAGTEYDVWWNQNGTGIYGEDTPACYAGGDANLPVNYTVQAAKNTCDTRMWLKNGSGETLCMDTGQMTGPENYAFNDVQISANQAKCADGGPPYSY